MLRRGFFMNNILNKYLYDTQYFTIREYTKNKVLFNEGEICDKIYYVISGTIEIKTYTYNEKEETITVVNDNDFFGDILAFTNQRRFLGHGICTTNVKLAYITKEKKQKTMGSFPVTIAIIILIALMRSCASL